MKESACCSSHHNKIEEKSDYTPLIIIIALIALASLAAALHPFSIRKFFESFMIGFFLAFSGFKFLDLKAFATSYKEYDLVAKRWPIYGYIYPFVELFFALAMLASFAVTFILLLEIVIMTISGFGVVLSKREGKEIQCACLGNLLKVPLTSVSLIEDFGMAALGVVLLLF